MGKKWGIFGKIYGVFVRNTRISGRFTVFWFFAERGAHFLWWGRRDHYGLWWVEVGQTKVITIAQCRPPYRGRGGALRTVREESW